jgi:flagellar basal-body rod protein FlgC
MSMFDAINIGGSGLNAYQTWLDAISDNVANINTAEPMTSPAFQAKMVETQAVEGGEDGTGEGVDVKQINVGSATGRVVYDPQNPEANQQGYVRMPDIDMGEQMSSMILAQRSYQANAAMITRAQQAYQAALQIGKS